MQLIEHDSPFVRHQALRMLRRSNFLEDAGPSARLRAGLIMKRFEDPEIDVRASAILTYWALRGAAALEEMQPFMEPADPRISSAAISGALRYGGEAAREIARPLFAAMVEHRRQAVRSAAASALGELPSQDTNAFLGILLDDSDPEVRRQAVQAAGQLADPTHLPAVIAQLGDPVVGPVADEALVRYGAQIFPYLETLYAEPVHDTTIRRHVPGVIASIHAPQSVRFLMNQLDEPDDLARSRVYIALGRLCQGSERLSEADLIAVNRRFEVESRLAYEWSVRAFNRRPGSNDDLLDDAYFWRRRYAVDRLLYLVAILYPQVNSALLRANLFGADQRRRSNAIEMLDTLLSHPHKERLLPLLESPAEKLLEIAEREYNLKPPALQAEFTAAVEGNDPWLAASILVSRSQGQVVDLSDLIRQALHMPDALVHETALWAANQNIPAAAYEIAWPATISRAHSANPPRKADHSLPMPVEAHEGGPVMPLTTMERILLLRRVALFKETPAQELERVARLCDVLYFAPGERFICQGDVSDGLYILVAGEVEVSTDDRGIIDVRREGDVIGEIGVLANQLRTASCTATVKTTALHINQEDLWDLLERDATLSVSVIRVLIPILLSYSKKRSSTATGRAPFHNPSITPS
jgi:HEAT repeat protein